MAIFEPFSSNDHSALDSSFLDRFIWIENSTMVTPEPEELVGMFFKMVEPREKTSYAVLPYIKGLTENITRTLRTHDIRVTNKPLKTLQQLFPPPKFRPPA